MTDAKRLRAPSAKVWAHWIPTQILKTSWGKPGANGGQVPRRRRCRLASWGRGGAAVPGEGQAQRSIYRVTRLQAAPRRPQETVQGTQHSTRPPRLLNQGPAVGHPRRRSRHSGGTQGVGPATGADARRGPGDLPLTCDSRDLQGSTPARSHCRLRRFSTMICPNRSSMFTWGGGTGGRHP